MGSRGTTGGGRFTAGGDVITVVGARRGGVVGNGGIAAMVAGGSVPGEVGRAAACAAAACAAAACLVVPRVCGREGVGFLGGILSDE